MRWIKAKWNAVMFWPRWFYDALVWIGCGFFVDSLIPDLPESIGMGRARTLVWTMTGILHVPWRVNEPMWRGVTASFRAYREMKTAAREMKKLEKQLQPLLRAYGKPGETVQEFVDRMSDVFALAKIGEEAKREKEAKSKDGTV